MNPALLLGLALLSALVVRLMIGRGVLDVPGARSSHTAPTPKGGGVGIAAAFTAGLGSTLALGQAGAPFHAGSLLAAGLLLAAVSWADDVGQFGFRTKLAAQVASCAILLAGGWRIASVGPLPLGLASFPLTFLFVLFTVNAVNFIDGLNGLAAGSVAIVAIATGTVTADPALRAALLSLAAGIVGFLPFNMPRARIFMGDVGSQLCGLLAGAAACSPAAEGAWTALLAPLGLFGILADVAFTLIRRHHAGQRLTEAHRGHLYQLAHRAGLDALLVTAIYWGFALWGSVLGLISIDATWGGIAAAIGLAAAPVLVWGLAVLKLARTAPIGPW